MNKKQKSELIFLHMPLLSSTQGEGIKRIEFIAVPGKKLKNGEYVVSEKMKKFFDDLIAREIFYRSSNNTFCSFQELKIWLYDTNLSKEEHQYKIPDLDSRDFEIKSNVKESSLKYIYVLDNGLTGREYEQWKRAAEKVLTPIFKKFINYPEPSEDFMNSPLGNFFSSSWKKVSPHSEMIDNLFFDALIIQID